jgi:hypothetical protein
MYYLYEIPFTYKQYTTYKLTSTSDTNSKYLNPLMSIIFYTY